MKNKKLLINHQLFNIIIFLYKINPRIQINVILAFIYFSNFSSATPITIESAGITAESDIYFLHFNVYPAFLSI